MTDFAIQMRRFTDKSNENIDKAVRKISLETFRNVIVMSPVDTGRFRGNWQTSIGAPVSGTVELVDPSGQMTVAQVAGDTQRMSAGDVIFMVNNLPYGPRLENGWSNQAPNGMVALTVQRFQPLADAVIREIAAEG